MRRHGTIAEAVRRVGAVALIGCALLATAQPLPLPLCPMRAGLAMAPVRPSPAARAEGTSHESAPGAPTAVRRTPERRSDRGDTPTDALPHPCGCFGQCVVTTPFALPAGPVSLVIVRIQTTGTVRCVVRHPVPPPRVDLRQPLATAPPVRT